VSQLLGKEKNGRHIPSQTEINMMEKMKNLRSERYSFHQIADVLQGLNLPTA